MATALGIIAVVVAPTVQLRLACVVYAVTAVLLSAPPPSTTASTGAARMNAILRRMDHSNIALIIAGTYTPWQ